MLLQVGKAGVEQAYIFIDSALDMGLNGINITAKSSGKSH